MKARRALAAAALATGLVLTMAGCGTEGDGGKKTSSESNASPEGGDAKQEDKPQEPAEDKVLAEVTGADDITLVINSAVRDDGGFLTVSGTVRNDGSSRWIAPSWRGDEKELSGNGQSMAGATLVDQAGKKRYLILRDTEGHCLCTQFTGGVKGGESATWYAQFPAPPQSTTDITFQIADMPPADIKITEGE
ncbi:hypothetical protein [Streptomyces cavernicola]|uniref:Secreted protein n=1 Tax=Streptomyces cavernicola TaxID=3043613 RepID=A0ABT6SIV2_9ACTN|nr:hypothetical protein [Streptomyces sp. B-S-A6]MDI3408085.1 hypothetical protein [Streptomyces sp. B-S-A6]